MRLVKKCLALVILSPLLLMFLTVKLMGDLVPWAINQIEN